MKNNMENKKIFLYARKSTDVEDKQVLSIDAQLTELREYAVRENIEISAEYIEKQSAKVPGRPIFNKMMKEIETFGGNILAWNPDRLARNSVDGGQIIYLLDTGKLASIKFPTFWCDNSSQGKFMLNMAFGQSKYYVDSLSENMKRGLRQKVCHIFQSHISFCVFLKSLKIGRPGTLADCFSINSWAMFRFSLLANSRNSVSCASIDLVCFQRGYQQQQCAVGVSYHKIPIRPLRKNS